MKFDLCLCPECLSHLWAQPCHSCLHGSLPPGSPPPSTGSHWRAGLGLIHIRGPQEALKDVRSVKAWLLSMCSLASLLLGNSRARRVPREQGLFDEGLSYKEKQKCIVSQPWRPEVQDQVVAGSVLGLSLWLGDGQPPPLVFPGVSRFFPFRRKPALLDLGPPCDLILTQSLWEDPLCR